MVEVGYGRGRVGSDLWARDGLFTLVIGARCLFQ